MAVLGCVAGGQDVLRVERVPIGITFEAVDSRSAERHHPQGPLLGFHKRLTVGTDPYLWVGKLDVIIFPIAKRADGVAAWWLSENEESTRRAREERVLGVDSHK